MYYKELNNFSLDTSDTTITKSNNDRYDYNQILIED